LRSREGSSQLEQYIYFCGVVWVQSTKRVVARAREFSLETSAFASPKPHTQGNDPRSHIKNTLHHGIGFCNNICAKRVLLQKVVY